MRENSAPMGSEKTMRILAFVAFVGLAALLRTVKHIPNVTPIAAMTLFAGAYFSRPVFAVIAALSGSAVFFVVTNFSVWLDGQMYSRTFDGMIACYVAALPFLRNALLGDLFFTGLLFGTWVLLENMIPRLREA